jgi:hypothetical protein
MMIISSNKTIHYKEYPLVNSIERPPGFILAMCLISGYNNSNV